MIIRPHLNLWPFARSIEVEHLGGLKIWSLFDNGPRTEVMTREGNDEETLTWNCTNAEVGVHVQVGHYDFEKGGPQITIYFGLVTFLILSVKTKAGLTLTDPSDIFEFLSR